MPLALLALPVDVRKFFGHALEGRRDCRAGVEITKAIRERGFTQGEASALLMLVKYSLQQDIPIE